ncbi:hypothetical protein [Pseudomonas zeae]|uniref:hypothetical protein n=1 Tax=Pseudomonas zeae TaxID=2745510 RepID=UPI0039E1CD02
MSRRYLEPVLPRICLIGQLGLSTSTEMMVNAWLQRILRAGQGKVARIARDEARENVAQLEQQRIISIVQADCLYTTIDRHWYDCLLLLEQEAESGSSL